MNVTRHHCRYDKLVVDDDKICRAGNRFSGVDPHHFGTVRIEYPECQYDAFLFERHPIAYVQNVFINKDAIVQSFHFGQLVKRIVLEVDVTYNSIWLVVASKSVYV